MALLVIASTGLVGSSPALDKCRALDVEFDTRAMLKPCQAAADDPALATPERVDALRLLASAHILNGDEALAEGIFLRMLVFAPAAVLPADAGPRFRQVLASAKKRLVVEGRLTATAAPPVTAPAGPVPVQVDVADRLGRILGARVVARVVEKTKPDAAGATIEDRLVRADLAPGLVRFTGKVPEPAELPVDGVEVSWDVVFDGWDGRPLEVEGSPQGRHERLPPAVEGDGDVSSLAWIAGGALGGVVVLGSVAGGLAWCFVSGPCRQQDAWVRVQLVSSSARAP